MIAALKAGVRRAHALCNEVARHTQALIREVAVNGEAGLLPKHTHHIIFAEVKGVRQRIDADVLGQVRVEVFENGLGQVDMPPVGILVRYSRMAAVFSLQCSDGA